MIGMPSKQSCMAIYTYSYLCNNIILATMYRYIAISIAAVQYSRVETRSDQVDNICPGQSGFIRFIKYPGLTQIDCAIRVFSA